MGELVRDIEYKLKKLEEKRKNNEKKVEMEKMNRWKKLWKDKIEKEEKDHYLSYLMNNLFFYYLKGYEIKTSLRSLIQFEEDLLIEENFKEKVYKDIETYINKIELHEKNAHFFINEEYQLQKMRVKDMVNGTLTKVYLTKEEEKYVIQFFINMTKIFVKNHLSLTKESIHVELLPYVLTYFDHEMMKHATKENCFTYLLFLHKQDLGKENGEKVKQILREWYQENKKTCIEECYRSFSDIVSLRYLLNEKQVQFIKEKEETKIRETMEHLQVEKTSDASFSMLFTILKQLKQQAEELKRW